ARGTHGPQHAGGETHSGAGETRGGGRRQATVLDRQAREDDSAGRPEALRGTEEEGRGDGEDAAAATADVGGLLAGNESDEGRTHRLEGVLPSAVRAGEAEDDARPHVVGR